MDAGGCKWVVGVRDSAGHWGSSRMMDDAGRWMLDCPLHSARIRHDVLMTAKTHYVGDGQIELEMTVSQWCTNVWHLMEPQRIANRGDRCTPTGDSETGPVDACMNAGRDAREASICVGYGMPRSAEGFPLSPSRIVQDAKPGWTMADLSDHPAAASECRPGRVTNGCEDDPEGRKAGFHCDMMNDRRRLKQDSSHPPAPASASRHDTRPARRCEWLPSVQRSSRSEPNGVTLPLLWHGTHRRRP
ncbi:hypothetical protein MRB53_041004 [Persea americana]|nr:hypothetical protein MRB53_041004 [Persea americana]